MKQNRRKFLQQSSVLLAGFSFNTKNKFTVEVPFAHHVFFWLKDKDNKEIYFNVLKSLQQLKTIKEVKFLHIGYPSISDVDFEASATDATYTFSYLAFFDSKKDKENYLKSPLHSKFFNDFKEVVSKVIIYDSVSISE